MASPAQHHESPSEQYSNLETVYHSPNAPPKADTGLQTYYTGDNGYEAKEVYRTSYPVALGTGGWKKRRACGIPMVLFVALVTVVLVAAIAGGIAGGVLGSRKKDPAQAQAETSSSPSSAVSATKAVSSTSYSASSSTSSTSSASSTSASVPYPIPGLPSDWYHSISNFNLTSVLTNLYKPALGGNLKLQTYVTFVDMYMEQYYQHWQFYAITPKHKDSAVVRSNPSGLTALYLLAARIPGQETLLVLNSDDYDTVSAGRNTSEMNIRLDMKLDDGDMGKFWFVEKTGVEENRVRIYNYKTGRKWWMAGEAGVDLGNDGVVYMTSEKRDGRDVWDVRERDFIKPEYDWIV